MLTGLRLLVARIRALFHSGDLDRDFSQELDTHLEMLTEENIGRGMDPVEARRQAAVKLGAASSLRSQHRDVRGVRPLADLAQDVSFAIRIMNKDRWFSVAAITVIALGIGANTVGFSIVNAAFIRGMGFADGDRLRIVSFRPDRGQRYPLSYPDLQDLREQSASFASLGAFTFSAVNISGDGVAPEQAIGATITANLFSVLRVSPILGRELLPDDERRGANAVVLINDDLWNRRYGRDPGIIGKTLRVDGSVATIVGVMPARMRFPNDTDLWMPLIPTDAQLKRDAHVLGGVVGRLRDGVDARDAAAEIDGLAKRIIADHPTETKGIAGAKLETMIERFVGGLARPMFITVMGAAIFVLLIACANVANLLLSRALYRGREVAVRYSLGATRGRIIRQLLIESLVLSAIGAVAGLGLGIAGVRAFDAAVQAAQPPYWLQFVVDYRVLGYVAAICIATGILFGLAPALHVARNPQQQTLKEGGRGSAGPGRRGRFGTGLVAAELALTVILLCGAGLMLRSFVTLYSLDPGFAVDGLLRMRLQLPPAKYPDAASRLHFFDELQPRLSAIPGITGAAASTSVPPLADESWRVELDGRSAANDAPRHFVRSVTVTPNYFQVLGVAMNRGRALNESDGRPGNENIVVSQVLADRLFPNQDPIGQRLRFVPREDDADQSTAAWRTIVGVTAPFLQGSTEEAHRSAVVFIPFRQNVPRTSSLVIRTALPPPAVMAAVREAVQSIDADQPLFTIESVANVIAGERLFHRIFAVVFGVLAAIGLTLSAVGIYGVMAYAVTQRTQEIGVRMAVGAQAWQVSAMFLKRCAMQLAIGLAIGLPGALALGQVVRFNLVQISPNDPLTISAITVVMIGVSLLACVMPARKAARVDPVIALRSE